MVRKNARQPVIIIFMKIVLSALAVLCLVPALALAQPAISFPEVKYDFGTVNLKDRVEHVFTFVNKGTEPLVIEKVAST